jgi:NAD(P)-dependent dehydrogenase (short-subunit alcohol dehydrogenase family)
MPVAKTFVVTGCTSGIGLALVRALAQIAGMLVIVGRSEAALQTTADAVRREAPRGLDLLPILADLATVGGTRSLADQLEQLPRVDVLIQNAGILPKSRRLTADGFEESFATNHLAPYVLNRELRRRLVARAPSRVVQVSAGLALGASVDLEGAPSGAHFEPVSTYATTKLWNLLATMAFAAELRGTGVTANAVHPGVVRTRLGEGAPGVPDARDRRGWLSPEEGARGPLHAATAPEFARTTGRFFNQTQEMHVQLPRESIEAVVGRTNEVLDGL